MGSLLDTGIRHRPLVGAIQRAPASRHQKYKVASARTVIQEMVIKNK